MFLHGYYNNMDITKVLEKWTGLLLLNVRDTSIVCESTHDFHHKTEIICLQEAHVLPITTVVSQPTTTTTTTTTTVNDDNALPTRLTINTTAIANLTDHTVTNINKQGTQTEYKSSFIIEVTIAALAVFVLATLGGITVYICVRRRIRERGYEINSPIYSGMSIALADVGGMDMESDL
jgi:hypothetical protein